MAHGQVFRRLSPVQVHFYDYLINPPDYFKTTITSLRNNKDLLTLWRIIQIESLTYF